MAASNQIVPYGSINHIGVEYMSPYGAATTLTFQNAAVAGTEFAEIDFQNLKLTIDTIDEFTATAGVTIEGVLLKDSEVTVGVINEASAGVGVTIDGLLIKDSNIRIANNSFISARNNANNADVTMIGLNTSDQIAFDTTIDAGSLTWDDAADARSSMSAAKSGVNSDITDLSVVTDVGNASGDLQIDAGGSGTMNFAFGGTVEWAMNTSEISSPNGAKDVGTNTYPLQSVYFNEKLVKKSGRANYTLGTYSLSRTVTNTGSITLQQLADNFASLIVDLVDLGVIE